MPILDQSIVIPVEGIPQEYLDRGKYFKWSFKQMSLEVNVHPVKATYDQQTDQIVLQNGVRGWFSPGMLHDNQLGTIVWKQKPTDCNDAVSQVYLGPAEIYEYTGGKTQGLDLLGNSIVILDDNVGSQEGGEEVRYAGLVLRQPGGVCGRRCYATQVEDLSLCLKRDTEKLEPLAWKTGFSVDLVTQEARLGHAHLQTNLRMYDQFAIIQQDLCKVERQVWRMPSTP